jgi:hypothetical protein
MTRSGGCFTDFFSEWDSMVHEITNIVVDPIGSKVSTEQLVDLNRNGTTTMHNCNSLMSTPMANSPG